MIQPNNIYCGDCYELIKQIPDKSVDLVYTDIPYLQGFGGGGLMKEETRIKLTESIKDFRNGIDYKILDEYVRVLKKINCFIWCSKDQILDILMFFHKLGHFEILVWCKQNCIPATNNTFLPDIEYCLYFREKGVRLNDGYNLKHKYYLSPTNKEDKDKYLHPTIKPLELVKTHILHTTQEGGGCPRYIYG